jgi:hypothetical protein
MAPRRGKAKGGREPVGRKKKESGTLDVRFELMTSAEWVARVEAEAERQGVTASAYVRQATSLKLDQDEAARRAHEARGGKG